MGECENEKNLTSKNQQLEKRISELSVENTRISNENYSLSIELRAVKSEKEKLLRIIEDLSKGYANMKS